MTPSCRRCGGHLGAKRGTIVIGAKPGAMDLGVELLEFLKSEILS
jgi:hypothetical protein